MFSLNHNSLQILLTDVSTFVPQLRYSQLGWIGKEAIFILR